MSEQVAAAIWLGVLIYAAIGGLFWLALNLGLMRKLNPSAATAPWRVRLLLAPGLVALWPLMFAITLSGPGKKT